MKKANLLTNILLIILCLTSCSIALSSNEKISDFISSTLEEVTNEKNENNTDSSINSSNDIISTENQSSSSSSSNTINEIDFSDKSYVAFGDSISFGAENSNNYEQMETHYPKGVAERLNMASYDNQAVNGATMTYDKKSGLCCMSQKILNLTTDYDIISVMLGVNDFTQNRPLGKMGDTSYDTIYGALFSTMNYLTTTFPNSYIFYMTPYKLNKPLHYLQANDLGYYLLDVCNAIKEMAIQFDIDVLDMYTYGNFELEMYDKDSDGLHPNQDFVTTYTIPQIANFIKENYK